MKVVLVACSGKKLDRPAPARDLYQGHLFKLSLEYVRLHHIGIWGILSAKHGLVMPDDRLDPYNFTVRMMDRDQRQAWVYQVDARLGYRLEGQRVWGGVKGWLLPQIAVTLLAGRDYTHTPGVRLGLAARLCDRGFCVETPLANMGIGKQRQWLASQMREPRLEVSA